MMELLESYDKQVAAGILARAALALANGETFDSKPIVDNEQELRAALIERAYLHLGLNPNDRSEEGIPGTSMRCPVSSTLPLEPTPRIHNLRSGWH